MIARGVVLATFLAAALTHAAPSPDADPDRRGVRYAGLPIFNYTTDLGLRLGALARRFDYGEWIQPFNDLWTLEASTSTRGPQTLWLSYEKTDVLGTPWRLQLAGFFTRNPFEPYFGLGNATSFDPDLKSQGFYEYAYRSLGASALLRRKVTTLGDGEIELGLAAQAESSSMSRPGTPFAGDFGTGDHPETILKSRFGVLFDRRDSEFIPSRGWYGAATLTPGFRFGERVRGWARLDLDYRRYDPLIAERWLVLATQLRATSGTEQAPLHEKTKLGSLGTVRGLPLNRYLSNASFVLRTELRSTLLRMRVFDLPLKGGTGVFVDTGKIGPTPSAALSSRTHVTWGATLFGSYFTDDFLGSADVGFSEDGTALYLRLGHAF